MYHAVLLLHVLGATVWTGGHLVLALGVLPGALAQGNVQGSECGRAQDAIVGKAVPSLELLHRRNQRAGVLGRRRSRIEIAGAMNNPVPSHAVAIQSTASCVCQVRVSE